MTLEKYHVPHKVKDLILDYYSKFSLSVPYKTVSSDWHQLEMGVITGCEIMATLFALPLNMVVKLANKDCQGPLSESGRRWILYELERLVKSSLFL